MKDKIQLALDSMPDDRQHETIMWRWFMKHRAVGHAALTLALELVQEDGKEDKNCPFCGGEVGTAVGSFSNVYCTGSYDDQRQEGCEFTPELNNADHLTKESAIRAWDTRHTPALDKFKEDIS